MRIGLSLCRSWLDRHMALETLAYWATALPQLLDGLTPADYESNLGRCAKTTLTYRALGIS